MLYYRYKLALQHTINSEITNKSGLDIAGVFQIFFHLTANPQLSCQTTNLHHSCFRGTAAFPPQPAYSRFSHSRSPNKQGLSPKAGGWADAFQTKTKARESGFTAVSIMDAKPVGWDNFRKTGVSEPGVIKPKEGAPRSFGGGFEPDRDVVWKRAGIGGEGGVRKGKTPGGVDESTIKTDKNVRGVLIRPRKSSVQERKLDEA